MRRWRQFTHETVFGAWHDGRGWLIRADHPGRAPFFFGAYAETARDAHWAAGQVAGGYGTTVEPLRLQ
jgi:hypothetical protein